MSWPLLLVAAVGGLLIYAAWIDFASLRIPNRIPVLIVALFAPFALVSGSTWQIIAAEHLSAACIMLLLGLVVFAKGWIGGGDLKLLAAVSLWLGLPLLVSGLFAISIAGMLLSLALIALRRSGLPSWFEARGFDSPTLQHGRGAPYAIAIAAGFLWVQFGLA